MGKFFCAILLIIVGRHVRVRQYVRQPTYAKESGIQLRLSDKFQTFERSLIMDPLRPKSL